MDTETATLIALVAAPFAVMAAVAAVFAWSLARRGRRTLRTANDRLESMAPVLADELAKSRASVVDAHAVLARARAGGSRIDTDLEAWTISLTEGRASIERLDSGRLRPAVRAMHIASALARIAMVWRAPAR